MRDYLPTGEQSQSLLRTDMDSNTTTVNPGSLTQKGDARSRKLKVVCKKCNSGWMGEIQKITKPILLPLLIGERKKLSQRKQIVLATWATMFSMIYERSTHPEIFAVTSNQRTAFKQSSMPLTNWIVWAAPFSDDCCPAIYMGFATSRKKGGPVSSTGTPDNTDDICRCQISVFGAGGVAFLTFSAAADYGFESLSKFVSVFVREAGFVQLWPTSGSTVRITDNRTSPLAFADMGALRDAFSAKLQAVRFANTNRR